MFDNKKLEQIESRINAQPCHVCGRMHSVHLVLSENGLVIQHSFSDDACDGFKEWVMQFLNKEIIKATFPLPPL